MTASTLTPVLHGRVGRKSLKEL